MGQCPSLDPAAVGDVIAGCAMPEAEQGMNVARIALLLAGLPDTVPGMTVNRFCSSGLQAVAIAADRIRLGEADVMIASGTESMSMVPMTGNKIAFNPEIFARDENIAIAYGMGLTAEKVAERWQISREAQDTFACESHRRALVALANGEFTEEIAPYSVQSREPDLITRKTEVRARMAMQDEGPRADTSMEALGRLKAVFARNGTVTAGNSSQMSDGAGNAGQRDCASVNATLGKFRYVAGAPKSWASVRRRPFRVHCARPVAAGKTSAGLNQRGICRANAGSRGN